jgi:hypothetical protein
MKSRAARDSAAPEADESGGVMARSTAWQVVAWVLALGIVAAPMVTAAPSANPTGWALFSPCERNCAVAAYLGTYVENSMADVLFFSPETPFTWDYATDDHFLGLTLSRYAATVLGRVDVEPEVGLGRRFGRQSVTEGWLAVFFRYRGFPWDETLLTSVAVSTGLNIASRYSSVEIERTGETSGYRVMHYFSPEITLALPSRPDTELMFRFHHRSGAYGLFNDVGGGAHYGSVGIRLRF